MARADTGGLRRISEESYQGAEEVEEAVLSRIETLKTYAERYPPDRFKRNNPGNYRAAL